MLSVGKLAQMAGSIVPLEDPALDRESTVYLHTTVYAYPFLSLPRRS